ncbi:hypothetical protein N7462_010730 [Penicillium macrosclerotiorum]|uniref:uncharacterized protein n=1 Tax=Penicillium macrosclerotiorum TaxID=303699 RepID=UPI0025475438|nr:uncharacterized protein N7462_010730 [Penicillium macrosclerotiorum]KAJ5669660.1 hypothetical protein N7462_010730 [Penicillium macrosclerotiorum]
MEADSHFGRKVNGHVFCGDVEDWMQYDLSELPNYYPAFPGKTLDGGRYLIEHKVGYGSYSTVWMAYDKNTRKDVALKIMKTDHSEIDIQKKIKEYLAQKRIRQRSGLLLFQHNFSLEGYRGSKNIKYSANHLGSLLHTPEKKPKSEKKNVHFLTMENL